MKLIAARLVLGLVVFVLVGWAAGALWTSVVGSSELEAMRYFAENRTADATAVAKVVTWAGSAYLLIPIAVTCCLVLLRAGLPREAFDVALSLAGAMLISGMVKLLVSRPRPPVEHLQAVTGWSFPSGHSTQAGAFWFSLVLALRAARLPPLITRVATGLALAIVLAVVLSRVYLGVHYPSDVIAGVLLGTGWAVFVASSGGLSDPLTRCPTNGTPPAPPTERPADDGPRRAAAPRNASGTSPRRPPPS